VPSYLPGALAAGRAQRSPKRWCASFNQSLSACRLESAVITQPQVRFEQRGSELVAVEIGQRSCSPLVGSVHRALFALGLDISSYRARPEGGGLVEHLVLERYGGGRIDGALSADAKAAILPIALRVHAAEAQLDTL
jgi:hypothetical protein